MDGGVISMAFAVPEQRLDVQLLHSCCSKSWPGPTASGRIAPQLALDVKVTDGVHHLLAEDINLAIRINPDHSRSRRSSARPSPAWCAPQDLAAKGEERLGAQGRPA